MSNSHRKQSEPQPSSSKNKILLPTWAIIILAIIYAVYQYFGQGTNNQGTIEPITPTIVVQAPPTVTVITQRPPTTVASSSSSSSSRVSSSSAKFDFYMLSLSWSPDYCAESGNSDPQQCSIGKKLGFVLHGLWPQYNQGYPSSCTNEKLPDSVQAKFPGLYPSASLYDHEWEKHGTCTGLTPEQYLTLTKKIKDSVVIPSTYRSPEQPVRVTATQFKKDFVSTNPTMTEQGLAVNCSGSGRYLSELYVCFSPDGAPTACSREIRNDEAKSCQNADFLVRNVR
jgi:ribonuclease T2